MLSCEQFVILMSIGDLWKHNSGFCLFPFALHQLWNAFEKYSNCIGVPEGTLRDFKSTFSYLRYSSRYMRLNILLEQNLSDVLDISSVWKLVVTWLVHTSINNLSWKRSTVVKRSYEDSCPTAIFKKVRVQRKNRSQLI